MNHHTEFTYNSRGQNTAVRDAANNTSTSTYDLLGNVTRLAGPLGGATNYTYDDMGRLVSESTVSGGTKSYEYNELNVHKKVTNARGQVRQIFYDATGRITGYTSPEGSVSYTYDANGNVLTVTDSHGTITRTYDALNRVSSYTDTYGKVIRYEYDAVGNLSKLIYPDNTAVTYAYDANHNLIRVTDWANRVTSYTYDVNNRVVGVTKPDGSVTTTVYDNKQRVISTVERTAGSVVITGFEYTYDNLSRIIEEKNLAEQTKLCYTYDNLSRVTARTVKKLSDNSVVSTETFTYDAAGNVTSAPDSCFQYDTNNRLIVFNGDTVSYDMDGNMLNNGEQCFTYDSANRLVTADGHTYTYNAEDVRIRNLCECCEDTTYTYDTNGKLSKLLCKTTNGVTTKYVYGKGLIGEEVGSAFKTYHFDCRGSTIAITDAAGNVTDTFAYDTYGKMLSRTGTSKVIFGYNGRDGVVTDDNGLIYMRARYYSPEMKRFINADIIAGEISNAITLNRFAYANGNPVSFVDPFGMSPERGNSPHASIAYIPQRMNVWYELGLIYNESMHNYRRYILGLPPYTYTEKQLNPQESKTEQSTNEKSEYEITSDVLSVAGYATDVLSPFGAKAMENAIRNTPRPNNIGKGIWKKQIDADVAYMNKAFDYAGYGMTSVFTILNTGMGIEENIQNGESTGEIITDAAIDIGAGAVSVATTVLLAKAGTLISPGWGTVIGLVVGLAYDFLIDPLLDAAFE